MQAVIPMSVATAMVRSRLSAGSAGAGVVGVEQQLHRAANLDAWREGDGLRTEEVEGDEQRERAAPQVTELLWVCSASAPPPPPPVGYRRASGTGRRTGTTTRPAQDLLTVCLVHGLRVVPSGAHGRELILLEEVA